MTEPVLSRVAEARTFLSKLWKLAAPYWWAEARARSVSARFRIAMAERWIARGLLLVVIFGTSSLVYLSKLFNDWNGRFYNALAGQECGGVLGRDSLLRRSWRSSSSSWRSTGSGCGSIWTIRWRQWLTGVYIADLARRQRPTIAWS